ncbi:hypothetical protein [Actinocorallia sp. A-T 12471]|uniref:hypothetical protein n=1 Tax=Actinocorallia sp. A-T 12471 TaxID=3089813 RepID=UPI0029CD8E22|nr:hypothetical protein [Actinocorallia sp. A-T 12471]MDX6742934.1 hypothetical protein [Actinocorallia sp. A-T 12471]
MIDQDLALTWFPLVQRPRPPGLPLVTRIQELADLATRGRYSAAQQAEVLNKAALIASDVGMPDLARSLCWRQFAIYGRAGTLTDTAVELAVQPPLNITRQMIREGRPEQAHAALEALHAAALCRESATIDDHMVDFGILIRTTKDHKTICTATWAALLADGTRALINAGRWKDAEQITVTHRGIGTRLLDGRQVSIIAHLKDGHPDQALKILYGSALDEQWEHAVAGILQEACRAAIDTVQKTAGQQLSLARDVVVSAIPSTKLFSIRVGLTALGTAEDPRSPEVRELAHAILTRATDDSYAARDTLAHPAVLPFLDGSRQDGLTRVVEASGLNGTNFTPEIQDALLMQIGRAERRLSLLLAEFR